MITFDYLNILFGGFDQILLDLGFKKHWRILGKKLNFCDEMKEQILNWMKLHVIWIKNFKKISWPTVVIMDEGHPVHRFL